MISHLLIDGEIYPGDQPLCPTLLPSQVSCYKDIDNFLPAFERISTQLSQIDPSTHPVAVLIDGPVGSGKSSLCYRIANSIMGHGWVFLDLAKLAGVSLSDQSARENQQVLSNMLTRAVFQDEKIPKATYNEAMACTTPMERIAATSTALVASGTTVLVRLPAVETSDDLRSSVSFAQPGLVPLIETRGAFANEGRIAVAELSIQTMTVVSELGAIGPGDAWKLVESRLSDTPEKLALLQRLDHETIEQFADIVRTGTDRLFARQFLQNFGMAMSRIEPGEASISLDDLIRGFGEVALRGGLHANVE